MHFRIGVNLGDIITDGTDIFGDGVNIAARLEGLAEGGGVTVSGSVYDQIKSKTDYVFDDIGLQSVKNIAAPVQVYRVRISPDDVPYRPTSPRISSMIVGAAYGILALLTLEFAGGWIWQSYFKDFGEFQAASASRKVQLTAAELRRLEVVPLPNKLVPGTTFQQCADCPSMVVVPAGTYIMGSPDDEVGRHATEIEGPQHQVKIARPFVVGQFEITFREWDACVAAGGCKHKPQDRGWGRGNRPVIYVNWFDTQQYVVRLRGRFERG